MRTTVAIAFVLALLGASPAYAVPHYSVSYSKKCIVKEAKAHGYGDYQTRCLLKLSFRESRWHNWSHSRSECHGLFQLSKGMAHGHPWWKPTWNTCRAIKYIKHRYGTPARALSHSYRYGWY